MASGFGQGKGDGGSEHTMLVWGPGGAWGVKNEKKSEKEKKKRKKVKRKKVKRKKKVKGKKVKRKKR